jgi:hypothetical protein
MNRPPGPTDFWWKKHQQECGGTYIKIEGPEMNKETEITSDQMPTEVQTTFPFPNESNKKKKKPAKPKRKTPEKNSPIRGVPDIRTFFLPSPEKPEIFTVSSPTPTFIPTKAPVTSSSTCSSISPDTSSSTSLVPFSGQGRILGSTIVDFFGAAGNTQEGPSRSQAQMSVSGAVRNLSSVIEVVELD